MIDPIRMGHDLAHRLAELARFVVSGHPQRDVTRFARDQRCVAGVLERSAKILHDEGCGPARDVDVFADQIAVHPRDEVVRIEIQILDARIQLGADVVAQPLRIHPDREISQRADAGAAGLGHLLAGHRDEAVRVDVIGYFVGRSGEFQHCRPEQRVEVDDVLAYEMQLLGVGSREKLREASMFAACARLAGVEVVLQRCEIADGGVQPHIEIFARSVGDRNAEVGGVAGNVPVVERFVAARLKATRAPC